MAVKVTVEKRPKRAGATPLFWLPAAQKVLRVAPALDAFGVGLFSTVQEIGASKVSCTLY